MSTLTVYTALLALAVGDAPPGGSDPFAALSHPEAATRVAAVGALARLEAPRARPALMRALADPEVDVQAAAASALAARADEALLEDLTRGLEGDDVTLRRGCVLALARATHERAYQVLAAQCRRSRFAFRWQVGEAIGRARNRRFIPLMQAALLEGDDWQVQEVAVLALAAMHDAVGIAPLLTSLKSNDEYVRKLACWRLGLIGDPRALQHLVDDMLRKYDTYETRIWGALAIVRITKGASGVGPSVMSREPEKFLTWWEKNRHAYGP